MDDQTTALQAIALTRGAVDMVFEDAASGARTARLVCTVAEFEREVIKERTVTGMKARRTW